MEPTGRKATKIKTTKQSMEDFLKGLRSFIQMKLGNNFVMTIPYFFPHFYALQG